MPRTIFAIGLVYFIAHLSAELFKRTRVPDVLTLMLLGVLLGPVLDLVHLDDFGEVGHVLSHITLIVILFEGGTHLNVRENARLLGNILLLSVLTFALTMLGSAWVAYQYLGWDWMIGLLLGAILGGISPAVVLPLARSLKVGPVGWSYVAVESAISDVLAIAIVSGFVSAAAAMQFSPGQVAMDTVLSVLLGAMVGIVGGTIWLLVLGAVRSYPNTGLTTIGFLLLLYGASEILGFSGAISAFFFGIMMKNSDSLLGPFSRWLRPEALNELTTHEQDFFDELVFVLKGFFFVYLGIHVQPRILDYMWLVLGIVGLLLLGRLLLVRLLLRRGEDRKEAAVISFMIPKGLAAAVLAGLPLAAGIAHGEEIIDFTQGVIFVSIVTTAVMVPLLEKTALSRFYDWFFRSRSRPAADSGSASA